MKEKIFLVCGTILILSSPFVFWRIASADIVPTAPSNPQFSVNESTPSVSLTWTNNQTDADRCGILRKLSTESWNGYNTSFTVGCNDTSYTDSTVTQGNNYDYKISACYTVDETAGKGGCSSALLNGVPVAPAVSIPAAPSNLSFGTITSGAVLLTWTDNSNNEDSFNIERRVSSTTIWSTLTKVNQADATSYNDNISVLSGFTYYYRIQACLAGAGCSDYSTSQSVTIPAITLNTPTNLSLNGTPSSSSVPLKWSFNSSFVDSFNIERRVNGASSWTTLAQIPSWSTVGQITTAITTYTDATVVSGTSYDYRIQACKTGYPCSGYSTLSGILAPTSSTTTTPNTSITTTTTSGGQTSGGSTSGGSSGSSVTTTTNYIPAAPSNLIKDASTTLTSAIALKWTDNAVNGDKFNIDRKLSTATIWTPLTQIQQTNITSYIDTTIASGYFYDYRVQKCLSSIGCSDYAYLSGVSAGTLGSNGLSSNATTTAVSVKTTTIKTTSATTTSTVATTTTTSQTTATSTGKVQTKATAVTSGAVNSGTNTTTTNSASFVSTTTGTIAPVVTSSTIISSVVPQQIPATTEIVQATTTEFSSNVQDIGLAIEQIKTTVDDTKVQLIKIVNDSADNIISSNQVAGNKIDTNALYASRDKLLGKINSSLTEVAVITPADINNLQSEVSKGIGAMKSVAGASQQSGAGLGSSVAVASTLSTLTGTIKDQSSTLKDQNAALLYKDTNKDGISDYDSVHVYNLDPVKPSPVSNYDGKVITAADKVVLGFDPTKKDLVKVEVQQPASSTAPVVSTYKVDQVALTVDKKVVIKGKALPNSFITIFVYSTPIMVTVKADSQGEWQYTLDKELENGQHTVYTATVNNSGNIVAKSSGYLFTKTAEAMTLNNAPSVQATDVSKPGLLEGNNLYIFIAAAIMIIGLMLILAGMGKREEK